MRNNGSNVHLRKQNAKFRNLTVDLQMLNVISIRLPIVPRSTAQHPLTTKPISNPSLSSLDQRPLTFHHPNSFHSKCKGPNQQIPFETKSILIKRITIISFLKRRNKDHAESFMPASANVILNYRTMIVY